MKMAKSVLLASVAGLAAMAGAQAADLPVKAKPVEYVKVCSLYGSGFFYLPGTQTCLKIGGYASYEAVFGGTGSHIQRLNGSYALNTRAEDQFYQRGRLNLSFDTRTQTEYGTLRTYTLLDVYFNTSNADYNSTITSNSYTPIPAFVYIQLAGFTVGKAVPLVRPDFSSLWTSAALFGVGDLASGNVGVLQAAYTAELGNGAKIAVGVQDSTYGRNPVYDTFNATTSPFATSWGNNTYGGQTWPDVVANFALNQAWGGFFVAGVVRNVNATYYQPVPGGLSATTIVETNGGPDPKVGWAAIAALEIKNIPTGTGDRVQIYGGYSEGIGHVLHSTNPGPSVIGVTGSTSNPVAYQSLAYAPILDAVYNAPNGPAGGNLQLTTFWGGAIGYEHYWIPSKLRTSIYGGFEAIRYNDAAKASLCQALMRPPGTAAGQGGQSLAATNCNFDIDLWNIGTRTVFTVVPGFDLIAEGLYTRVDAKLTGLLGPSASNLKPAAVYELKPQDVFSGYFRAIRSF